MPQFTARERLYMTTLEERILEFDFLECDAMGAGETLAGLVGGSLVSVPSGLTFASPVVNGLRFQCRISGGAAGTEYEVRARFTTSQSQTLEARGVVEVAA